MDGLIAQAILIGDIENAVELCIAHNRMADALIIAMTGGADLLARTQHRYLQQSDGYVSALISALVSEDWSSVVNQCTVDSWKETLAATLTYSSADELPILCGKYLSHFSCLLNFIFHQTVNRERCILKAISCSPIHFVTKTVYK